MEEESNTITRSMFIDVWLPEGQKDKYQSILNSIRHYRAVARHVYALWFEAHAAGASFRHTDDSFALIPHNDRAKEVLAFAMNMKKEDGSLYKAPVYEVRNYVFEKLAPTWMPFVFDSMRIQVNSRWMAPDTEFPKARRGFMSLQGARGVAQLQRIGIGIPQATGKPRLEGHSVFLTWDREIGEIEFKFEKLDSGRFWLWRNICENPNWSAGTVSLTERDGCLRVIVSYTRPKVTSDLDATRELVISFNDKEAGAYLRMRGPDGAASYDSISVVGALGGIDELARISHYYDARKGAMGNKRAPWGLRKGFKDVAKTLNNVANRRELQLKDWNHRWTRRIIENVKRWRCGKVVVEGMPVEKMFNRSWQWHQFKTFLKYKVEEIGGVIEHRSVQIAQAGSQ